MPLASASPHRRSVSDCLDRAKAELAAEPEFDAVVVNESVERACDELITLLRLRA